MKITRITQNQIELLWSAVLLGFNGTIPGIGSNRTNITSQTYFVFDIEDLNILEYFYLKEWLGDNLVKNYYPVASDEDENERNFKEVYSNVNQFYTKWGADMDTSEEMKSCPAWKYHLTCTVKVPPVALGICNSYSGDDLVQFFNTIFQGVAVSPQEGGSVIYGDIATYLKENPHMDDPIFEKPREDGSNPKPEDIIITSFMESFYKFIGKQFTSTDYISERICYEQLYTVPVEYDEESGGDRPTPKFKTENNPVVFERVKIFGIPITMDELRDGSFRKYIGRKKLDVNDVSVVFTCGSDLLSFLLLYMMLPRSMFLTIEPMYIVSQRIPEGPGTAESQIRKDWTERVVNPIMTYGSNKGYTIKLAESIFLGSEIHYVIDVPLAAGEYITEIMTEDLLSMTEIMEQFKKAVYSTIFS